MSKTLPVHAAPWHEDVIVVRIYGILQGIIAIGRINFEIMTAEF